jgi:hypothetical protein
VIATFQEKQAFQIHTDPSAAQAEVERFLATVSATPVTLQTTIDQSQAIRELDLLRAKIADTPEGELKIALKAEASALEKKIAEAQQEAEKPAIKPIDADISAALSELDKLNAQIEANIGNVAHGRGHIHGDAATTGDIQNIVADAGTKAAEAIRAGDAAALAGIRTDLQDFLRSFGRPVGTSAAQSTVPADIAASVNEIFNSIRASGLAIGGFGGGTGLSGELRGALDELRRSQESGQDSTNGLLHDGNDIARGQLSATRDIASGLRSRAFAVDQLKNQEDASRLAGVTR